MLKGMKEEEEVDKEDGSSYESYYDSEEENEAVDDETKALEAMEAAEEIAVLE